MNGNINVYMSKTTDLIKEVDQLKAEKQELLKRIEGLKEDVEKLDRTIERKYKELSQ